MQAFREWAPEWLIRLTILLVIAPGFLVLGLYGGNLTEAAGFYGIEPADAQYSILVYYVGLASFFPLEQRLVSYFTTRHYFLFGVFLMTGCNYLLYTVREPFFFLLLRFVEGICISGIMATGMSLIFSRLADGRARIMGYAIFYGLLMASASLSLQVASSALHYFDFYVLYQLLIYLQLPGAILLFFLLKDVRLRPRIPLYQVELPSFILLVAALLLWGYTMVYGQQENWLDSPKIVTAALVGSGLTVLFVMRQQALKRPFIRLELLRNGPFVVSLLVLLFFYICRGTLGLAMQYFSSVLQLDPLHISLLMIPNLAGIALGTAVIPRFLLRKKSIQLIWLSGFGLLAVYHLWMYGLFDSEVEMIDFIGPLFCQGVGVAVLMVPVIHFSVSSVPASVSSHATALGVITRYLGFSLSIALLNFSRLYAKSIHYHRIQEQVTVLNPYTGERLAQYKQQLIDHGMQAEPAALAAQKGLGQAVDLQAQLRYSMDYYLLMAGLIGVVMIGIALMPYLKSKLVFSKQPPVPF
ncbi:MFS transporter [Siphonobacter aquaeclarae]|uniref:Major Facilitator Superfamily protein n=1 Tax=Siphonobacter aquaeclarae TaxID=563176 RepID=A0A1G9KC34_9BACT|nr:MFS transporter [Siphonobacter aquaeclarae]SDL46833.1 Major Facilitator Superfamily protein [Siphonobacter aquaeclarae]